jgi:hypothetical protein
MWPAYIRDMVRKGCYSFSVSFPAQLVIGLVTHHHIAFAYILISGAGKRNSYFPSYVISISKKKGIWLFLEI